jgi:hypothetical protein
LSTFCAAILRQPLAPCFLPVFAAHARARVVVHTSSFASSYLVCSLGQETLTSQNHLRQADPIADPAPFLVFRKTRRLCRPRSLVCFLSSTRIPRPEQLLCRRRPACTALYQVQVHGFPRFYAAALVGKFPHPFLLPCPLPSTFHAPFVSTIYFFWPTSQGPFVLPTFTSFASAPEPAIVAVAVVAAGCHCGARALACESQSSQSESHFALCSSDSSGSIASIASIVRPHCSISHPLFLLL